MRGVLICNSRIYNEVLLFVYRNKQVFIRLDENYVLVGELISLRINANVITLALSITQIDSDIFGPGINTGDNITLSFIPKG